MEYTELQEGPLADSYLVEIERSSGLWEGTLLDDEKTVLNKVVVKGDYTSAHDQIPLWLTVRLFILIFIIITSLFS